MPGAQTRDAWTSGWAGRAFGQPACAGPAITSPANAAAQRATWPPIAMPSSNLSPAARRLKSASRRWLSRRRSALAGQAQEVGFAFGVHPQHALDPVQVDDHALALALRLSLIHISEPTRQA